MYFQREKKTYDLDRNNYSDIKTLNLTNKITLNVCI